MNVKERLIQGLSEAGCSQETAERISTLYETGSYDEMHGLPDPASGKADEVKKARIRIMMKKEELKLTQDWDKTFPKSDKVDHCKVTFVNRYGITLAADMYSPKEAEGKLPAIAVCGPFGAVKEQCAGLYAQTMAERGFLTIAFDPSFTGESGGNVRYMASPDINTEDFMAAVDFLSLCDKADPERIGIIGICGWGGMALNTAALDTRLLPPCTI